MHTVAFDTETYPIIEHGKSTNLVCPKMVCLSHYDGRTGDVLGHEAGAAWFVRHLRDSSCRLVAHNSSFDLAVGARAAREFLDVDVSEAVFKALEDERISDTLLREKLRDIGRGGIYTRGGYSLADLADRHLGAEVAGKGAGAWRMRYNELFDEPVSKWPDAAYEYAELDPKYTYRIWKAQDDHPNESFQTACGVALHLISCWGAEVDLEYSRKIDDYYARREEKFKRQLEESGLIVDGTLKRAKKRELVAEAWEEVGEPPTRTDKGNISTKKEVLRELEDKGVEDDTFEALIRYNRATKFRSTYMEPLLDAGEAGEVLCPRYHTLVNSGRSSSSGPNIQNFPARTTLEEDAEIEEYEGDDRIDDGVVVGPDIRGCLVPRDGRSLVTADYSSLEMATLAQVIRNVHGELTSLGEAINDGKDLHLLVASTLTKRDYETCVEAYEAGEKWVQRPRRVSKVINYSRPVGAGAETIQGQLRQQGVEMSIGEVEAAIADWNDTWPEMQIFERHVQSFQSTYEGPYWVEQHGPDRAMSGWRLRMVDGDERASAMNTLFQGVAGDGAKLAGYQLQQASFTDESSPLYHHADVWAFIHDEYVIECDEGHEEECGEELSRIMIEAMQVFTPDIEIEADWKVLEERWAK